jgi:hypothetical protein
MVKSRGGRPESRASLVRAGLGPESRAGLVRAGLGPASSAPATLSAATDSAGELPGDLGVEQVIDLPGR